MVNVDEDFPVADARNNLAQALKTGAIRCHDAVKLHSAFRLLEQTVAVEETVFVGNRVLIPAEHFFAFILQGQGQAEL